MEMFAVFLEDDRATLSNLICLFFSPSKWSRAEIKATPSVDASFLMFRIKNKILTFLVMKVNDSNGSVCLLDMKYSVESRMEVWLLCSKQSMYKA